MSFLDTVGTVLLVLVILAIGSAVVASLLYWLLKDMFKH